jgi:hypothetical protein
MMPFVLFNSKTVASPSIIENVVSIMPISSSAGYSNLTGLNQNWLTIVKNTDTNTASCSSSGSCSIAITNITNISSYPHVCGDIFYDKYYVCVVSGYIITFTISRSTASSADRITIIDKITAKSINTTYFYKDWWYSKLNDSDLVIYDQYNNYFYVLTIMPDGKIVDCCSSRLTTYSSHTPVYSRLFTYGGKAYAINMGYTTSHELYARKISISRFFRRCTSYTDTPYCFIESAVGSTPAEYSKTIIPVIENT